MAEQIWHYSANNDRHGPVTEEEMRRLVAVGDIGPDDLVWKQGMIGWVAAGRIKGLLRSLRPCR